MTETQAKHDVCGICGGTEKEHDRPDVRHAFSVDGQLQTKKQAAKERAASTPQRILLPGAQTNEAGAIGRLVEVLLEKGVLDSPEALYVAGMGPKPEQGT